MDLDYFKIDEEGFELIRDIYSRVIKVFKTNKIIVIGGAAAKLTCDFTRPVKDIDIVIPPVYLYNVSESRIIKNYFNGIFEGNKLEILIDNNTRVEIECTSKHCGNLNKTIGLPAYTENNPTVLGINLNNVLKKSYFININGTKIRVSAPVHQIIMKYNLWLFRGKEQYTNQKDANDIKKLIKTFYPNINIFLEKEAAEIKLSNMAKPFNIFSEDIKKICLIN